MDIIIIFLKTEFFFQKKNVDFIQKSPIKKQKQNINSLTIHKLKSKQMMMMMMNLDLSPPSSLLIFFLSLVVSSFSTISDIIHDIVVF